MDGVAPPQPPRDFRVVHARTAVRLSETLRDVANPKCGKAPGCGVWTPPKVDNPDYKGKWYPPQVDNPAYKGPWAPRKIPNKEFFQPKNPSKNLKPVGAVAVEVWTTNGGIAYDNFYLGGSEVEAKESPATGLRFKVSQSVQHTARRGGLTRRQPRC